MKRLFCLFAVVLLLSACGQKVGAASNRIEGTYITNGGAVRFTFESNGKVNLFAGITKEEGSYKVDGDKITISSKGKDLVLTQNKDGSLSGYDLGPLMKN